MPSHLLARKPINHSHRETGLRRALGPVALTALGVGAIIGSGIFVTTGEVAAKNAGPGVVLAFVVAYRRRWPVPGVSLFTGGRG